MNHTPRTQELVEKLLGHLKDSKADQLTKEEKAELVTALQAE